MDEKGIPTHSTTEKPASKGSDMEREPDLEKDVESFAGVDEKVEKEARQKAELDPNVVDWDGEVWFWLLFLVSWFHGFELG
jgi:hypothetical protein